MAITVILHIMGAEPLVAEIEELPPITASYITVTNVRERNGRAWKSMEADATRIMFPWHRLSFVETMPSEEDQEAVESFFRD
ncbi:MAG: hypothetical protein AAF485_21605 [Chloroflexota bacterium]